MAEININVETTVSTTIRLDVVSLEKYFKILNYIESVTGKKTPIFPKTAVDTEGKAPEKTEDPYRKVDRYKNHEDVIALFKDAEANPSAYTWEWRLSKVWKSECPTLENASLHGVAHTLGSMYVHKLVQKSERYNDELKIYENLYRVPVPIKAEKAEEKIEEKEAGCISPANLFRGRKLREARKERHLTIGELSLMIGYDASIINKWECGLYMISSVAQAKLEECFGKELFAEEVA